MAGVDCEDIIRKGLGRNLREDEIKDFFIQAKRLFKELKANRAEAKLAMAARQAAEQKQIEAIARKRAIKLDLIKRIEAVRHCLEDFRGMEGEGIAALLTGSSINRNGGRLSVDAIGTGLEGRYCGGFLAEVMLLGREHFALLRKGALDREIAEAMWTIDNPGAAPFTGSPQAMEIARVAHKWQEKARHDQNNAGAWIGREPGYIVRQSHDPSRMHSLREGEKEKLKNDWKKFVSDRLDWSRTADGRYDPKTRPEEADRFLTETYYSIVSGEHLKLEGHKPELTRTSVMGSAAARVSHERVLHFKSGGDWFDYNARYGTGNLRDALLGGLSRAARNTALMRVFGPSPQANLDAIIQTLRETLRRRHDVEGVRRVERMRHILEKQMKEVDGTANIDGNPTGASVARMVRNMESMAKLGGAMISSLSDIGTFSSEFAYQGKPFFTYMARGVMEMAKGRGGSEKQRLLSTMGVFFDSMSGSVVSRFSGNDLPGNMSGMMNLFFRLNGLSWWTDCWKKAAALMMAHDLALERSLSWGELPHARRRALSLYRIDEGMWEMIRKRDLLQDDGREYICPELAQDIPDAELRAYLEKQGKKWRDTRGQQLRDTIEERLRTYFRDRVQYAVLEPDARTRAFLHQGTSSGTGMGEVLRFFTQFKSFPTVFLQRAVGRELYGRRTEGGFFKAMGSSLLHSVLKDQHGEINKLAMLFLTMTAFGYASMTIKQLLAGKTPREFSRKTLLAAAAQGGGLGIYGDFLFGEKSRMGTGIASSLAGPAFGTLENLVNLYQNIRDGNYDVKSEAFRTFFNMVPGNNLPYFRLAFDHLIGYELYEKMNPGYLRRMRRRIKRENGQSFWLEPR